MAQSLTVLKLICLKTGYNYTIITHKMQYLNFLSIFLNWTVKYNLRLSYDKTAQDSNLDEDATVSGELFFLHIVFSSY